jgi:hypothetical protein
MRRRIAFLVALTTALAAHAHAAGYRRTITVSNLVGAAESSFGIAIAGTPAGGLLVGAPVDSAGSAQLFDATTGALLRIFPGPLLSYQFGISVEAFGDDVLVGDPSFLLGDASAGGAFVGAVHRLDAATGTVEHTFLAPSPTADAGFGRRIALRGGELLVAEIGAVHRYDLASNAFLGSFVAPAGSSPSGFGIGLVALGSLVAVGDPDANRVVVFDAATGAPVQTIPHPVPGEAAAFGRSLAVVDGDLLVGRQHRDRLPARLRRPPGVLAERCAAHARARTAGRRRRRAPRAPPPDAHGGGRAPGLRGIGLPPRRAESRPLLVLPLRRRRSPARMPSEPGRCRAHTTPERPDPAARDDRRDSDRRAHDRPARAPVQRRPRSGRGDAGRGPAEVRRRPGRAPLPVRPVLRS